MLSKHTSITRVEFLFCIKEALCIIGGEGKNSSLNQTRFVTRESFSPEDSMFELVAMVRLRL